MSHKEEKKRQKSWRREEEEHDEDKRWNGEEEDGQEYEDEEEDTLEGRLRNMGDGREREKQRRVEGSERGGRRKGNKREEQEIQEKGSYDREIAADHIPVHPVAAPYLKWKVFVRGSEGILQGSGVRGEESEEWREKHRFTSTLDGEATRSFYESITGQTDAQIDRDTERQADRHTDTETDRENEEDSNSQKDNNTDRFGNINAERESYGDTDRHELRTSIYRSRETDTDGNSEEEADRYKERDKSTNTDKRHKERHRHLFTNRKRKAKTETCTDINKHTQTSAPNTHPSHAVQTRTHSRPSTSMPTPTFVPTPQDTHMAFRFAQDNDVTSLNAVLERGMSVNTKDVYGWSLLMVAACAGAADVVRMLLTRKARTGLRDAKGNTAIYLATIKGHRNVTEMLVKANKRKIPEREDKKQRNGESSSSETAEDEEYFCDTCGIAVKERERTKHKASIIHQFKAESGPARTHYGIPPSNRGYQLLVGQGWDTEGGLGSEKQGQKFPVKTVLKRNREGLGAEGESKSKARVTHFGPGDEAAIKRERKEGVRIERAATVSKREMRMRKEREQKEEVRLRRMLNEPDY